MLTPPIHAFGESTQTRGQKLLSRSIIPIAVLACLFTGFIASICGESPDDVITFSFTALMFVAVLGLNCMGVQDFILDHSSRQEE